MLRKDEWTAAPGNLPISECQCDHSNSFTPQYIILEDSQGNVVATLVSDSNKCWTGLEPFPFAGKQWKKRTTRIEREPPDREHKGLRREPLHDRWFSSEESKQTEETTLRGVGCWTC